MLKSDRHILFDDFCRDMTGDDSKKMLFMSAQLKPAIDLFNSLYPPESPLEKLPDFSDPAWSRPHVVYTIRNRKSGAVYVGKAVGGFTDRYPAGRWWEGHHNGRLAHDIAAYGFLGFQVFLYPCQSEEEVDAVEAKVIMQSSNNLYNSRLEPQIRQK